MPDNTPPLSGKPHPSLREGENVHERPEVKPLVEKAGAERDRRVPQGTMKTGADVPGGGGTKSLEDPAETTRSVIAPEDAQD